MPNQLSAALALLTSTNKDIQMMASHLVVDASEVASALALVNPDSSEGVALRLLAKFNPIKEAPVQRKPLKLIAAKEPVIEPIIEPIIETVIEQETSVQPPEE